MGLKALIFHISFQDANDIFLKVAQRLKLEKTHRKYFGKRSNNRRGYIGIMEYTGQNIRTEETKTENKVALSVR